MLDKNVSLELKPCPFCGFTFPPGQTTAYHVTLHPCPADSRGVPDDIWNDAYCWKQLEQKDAQIAKLQAQLEKDSIAFTGIIREKDKIIERQDKSLWDLVQSLENFKRWDEAVTNADHSFVELTEMRINALADMFDVLAKHKPAGEK